MRKLGIAALTAMAFCAGGALGQDAAIQNRFGFKLNPLDQTHVFTNAELQNVWKEIESRPAEGTPGTPLMIDGKVWTLFSRILKPSDPPRTTPHLFELWMVTAGTATVTTGGKLIDGKPLRAGGVEVVGTAIEGGVDRPLKSGDLLYISPGDPHVFKNIKGFRALLVRIPERE